MKYLLAVHIIAIVCWFAGLFYLPRLFVYHAAASIKEVKAQFKIMEYKLYYYIMMPAMVVSLLTGLILMVLYVAANPEHLVWLWQKLFLVMLLLIFHFYCGYCIYEFAHDQNQHGHRFYRLMNEVPTILLIIIVILAVVQPY